MPGAGLALLRAIEAVEREEGKAGGDERTGLRIRKSPRTRAWMEGVVAERMRTGSANYGLDASKCAYVDLVETGIIRGALQTCHPLQRNC